MFLSNTYRLLLQALEPKLTPNLQLLKIYATWKAVFVYGG
jgi:hypothetical protein